MQSRTRHASAWLSASLAIALAGCSELTGGGRTPLSLSFASSSSSASALQASFSVPITAGGHTLDLTSAQLQIRSVELERAEGGEDSDEADSDGEGCELNCQSFISGPLVVDLPVDGGVVTPFTTDVPAGRYSEVEFDLGSVRLKGSFDGAPFDVTVALNLESELEFHPPVEIGGSSTRNITIATPLSRWLRNPDGSLIDPRRLETDSQLRSAFRARVRAALRTFADQNRNGEDSDDDR